MIGEVVSNFPSWGNLVVAELDPDLNSEYVFHFGVCFIDHAHSTKQVRVRKYSSHYSENQAFPESLHDLEICAIKINLELASLLVDFVLPHRLDLGLKKTN